jgi:ASPM-SPD-2-Hydin domain-containing protein
MPMFKCASVVSLLISVWACGGSTMSPSSTPTPTPTTTNSVLSITGTNYTIVGIPSLRFATTPIGSSSTLPLSLQNTGTGTLSISDMKLGGWLNDTSHFSVSATTTTIAPNQTITVNVTFAPKFSTGICFMETQLTVVGNQSGGDVKIGLHGDLPAGRC